MCGIAGFIDFGRRLDEEVLQRMVAALHHRGPDDSGAVVTRSDSAIVGLGHARLSILDLSESGRQPMVFGDLQIVFNGEIYNFRELRAELEKLGHGFTTGTDTEVILHAFREWGIDCLQRFVGMFAFCLYDARAEKVYLVRDRAGVKPLFVYQGAGLLLFASELKAFHECAEFPGEVSQTEIVSYFDYGFVPGAGCIFKGCAKVDAGEYWVVDVPSKRVQKRRYWSVHEHYLAPKLEIGYPEAVDELERLLRSACEYRLISDVPVGVFLSGGYDSTAVASVLQHGRAQKIRTFTIGFAQGNDEAPFARETARHLGTDHHELYCTESEAQALIPQLPWFYDEPFGDSSAIPTMLVSQMARNEVKVALSADAGDEVFGGYDSYRELHKRMEKISRIPRGVRACLRPLGGLSSRSFPASVAGMVHRVSGFSRALSASDSVTGQRLHAFAGQLPAYYRDNVLSERVRVPHFDFQPVFEDSSRGLEGAMAADYASYLKDDILVKVDRATMSVGLEGREPLVDHRLLEFAARLPIEFKFDGRTTKRILKDVVHRFVPKEMMGRPKTGFSLPIYSWLRNDLSYLLDELCSPRALRETGFLNEPFLSKQVVLFRKHRLHYSPLIWRLLMFQMWHHKWGRER